MASALEQVRKGIEEYARGAEVSDRPTRQWDTYTEVKIADIDPDPDQPRKDLGDLEEIKASIRDYGLIQPVILTPVEETRRFRLLAGERRFTAAKELGLTTIKAIVRTVAEQQRLYMQVIENVQRKDLNAFEEARSYKRLMDEFNLTQEQVAEKVGKSQPAVSQTLRVLDLPQVIQEDHKHAYNAPKSLLLEVVRQPTEDAQLRLWNRIKTGDIGILQARRQRKEKDAPEGAERTAPRRFSFTAKLISGVITFRDGDADEQDLIEVLETWILETKKIITERAHAAQEDAPPERDSIDTGQQGSAGNSL